MKKLTGAQIRQMYLDFFKEKGHTLEPTASTCSTSMIHHYFGLIVV